MLHTHIIHQHITFTNSSFFSQGGDDFVSQQYQLHFPAGQTRAEFTVVITDDNLIEAMESFQLLLSIPKDLISKGVQVGPNSHPLSLSLMLMVSSMALTVSMVAPYVYMNHYCEHWSFISLYCLCHIQLIYIYICMLSVAYVCYTCT